MPYLLVRHKVADFDRWKRVFDSHSAAQLAAGMRATHIMRNVDDRNEVIVLLECEDLDRARAFTSAPDVSNAQEAGGVIDEPDGWFLV